MVGPEVNEEYDERDDLPEAMDEGIWYRWSCPSCGEINESENDTRSQIVECDVCSTKAVHRGGG